MRLGIGDVQIQGRAPRLPAFDSAARGVHNALPLYCEEGERGSIQVFVSVSKKPREKKIGAKKSGAGRAGRLLT